MLKINKNNIRISFLTRDNLHVIEFGWNKHLVAYIQEGEEEDTYVPTLTTKLIYPELIGTKVQLEED